MADLPVATSRSLAVLSLAVIGRVLIAALLPNVASHLSLSLREGFRVRVAIIPQNPFLAPWLVPVILVVPRAFYGQAEPCVLSF